MKQLTLFDDYGPILTIEQEANNMTWNELYDFLTSQKNDNPELFRQHVMIHNVETDDEYTCDTLIINNRLVLAINLDAD